MRTILCAVILASLVCQPSVAPAATALQGAAKLIQPSPGPADASAAPPKSEATPSLPAPEASPTHDAPLASESAPLTNDDVLALVDADIDWQVIVEKIKAARATKFDTSPDALAQLRGAGANSAVVAAMLPPRDAAQGASASEAAGRAGGSKADQTPLPASVKIPAGVHVDLEMAHTIDSLTTRTGDLVSLRVVNPVVVDGVTVVAVGATATAKVIKAERNGHWGRAGRITWELKEVTAVDGSRVPIAATGHVVGDSHGAKVAAVMALSVLSPAALAVGFKRGENAVVPEGKRFDAVTANEATVNPSVRR
jgi:hypothetical protein